MNANNRISSVALFFAAAKKATCSGRAWSCSRRPRLWEGPCSYHRLSKAGDQNGRQFLRRLDDGVRRKDGPFKDLLGNRPLNGA